MTKIIALILSFSISFFVNADAQVIQPSMDVIDAYVKWNQKMHDTIISKDDISYGHRDVNGDGTKDWYLYQKSEENGYCRTEVFLNKDNSYCYGGSVWLHRIKDRHPALICKYQYIFDDAPAIISEYYFKLGQANYHGDKLVIQNEKRELDLIEGNLIGFNINYKTSNKNSTFTLKLILPKKVRAFRLPGYASKMKISEDGTATYEFSKTIKIGLHNIRDYIKLTEGDPAGEWKFEFYIDDKLLKTASVNLILSSTDNTISDDYA